MCQILHMTILDGQAPTWHLDQVQEPTPASHYGGRLREARLAQDMTQETLAKRAGLATRTVIRIESGEDARVGTISALAQALGISVSDILKAAS